MKRKLIILFILMLGVIPVITACHNNSKNDNQKTHQVKKLSKAEIKTLEERKNTFKNAKILQKHLTVEQPRIKLYDNGKSPRVVIGNLKYHGKTYGYDKPDDTGTSISNYVISKNGSVGEAKLLFNCIDRAHDKDSDTRVLNNFWQTPTHKSGRKSEIQYLVFKNVHINDLIYNKKNSKTLSEPNKLKDKHKLAKTIKNGQAPFEMSGEVQIYYLDKNGNPDNVKYLFSDKTSDDNGELSYKTFHNYNFTKDEKKRFSHAKYMNQLINTKAVSYGSGNSDFIVEDTPSHFFDNKLENN